MEKAHTTFKNIRMEATKLLTATKPVVIQL